MYTWYFIHNIHLHTLTHKHKYVQLTHKVHLKEHIYLKRKNHRQVYEEMSSTNIGRLQVS